MKEQKDSISNGTSKTMDEGNRIAYMLERHRDNPGAAWKFEDDLHSHLQSHNYNNSLDTPSDLKRSRFLPLPRQRVLPLFNRRRLLTP